MSTGRNFGWAALALVGCAARPDGGDSKPAPCATYDWYADANGDGFGVGAAIASCDGPADASLESGDCDDTERAIHPGATEICDGLDQDCDGDVDEGLPQLMGAPDADGDGYGAAGQEAASCTLPAGWSEDATDCDDSDAAVSPSADEVCNGFDDDCDGLADDDDPDVLASSTFWIDGDGDGHGDPARAEEACAAAPGRVSSGDDCDDTTSAIHPGAAESCLDSVDQDCDGPSDDYSGACWPTEVASAGDCGTGPPNPDLCTDGVAAVDQAGGQYATIQGAVDAASDGEELTVCPGVWAEALLVEVSVALVGFGPGVTIIEGAGAGDPVVTVRNVPFTLAGISIESGDSSFGAVHVNSSNLCVSNSAFAWNVAAGGSSIHADGASPTEIHGTLFFANDDSLAPTVDVSAPGVVVDGSRFDQNTVVYGGSALHLYGNATVTHTSFTRNEQNSEGAFRVTGDGATVTLEDVRFESNTCFSTAAAISIESGTDIEFKCSECTFLSNTGRGGGAVEIDGDGTKATFSSSTFEGNTTSFGQGGGAVRVDGESVSVTFTDTTFTSNTSDTVGGAIDASPSEDATITITGGSLTSNTASTSGGAVELASDTILESTGVDWGEGGADNSPDDLAGTSFGADATFSCADSVCE